MDRFGVDRVVYETAASTAESDDIVVPLAAAKAWEDPGASLAAGTRADLVPSCEESTATVLIERPWGTLGRGSERELHRRVTSAMKWASQHYQEERGPFEIFAQAVGQVAVRRFFLQFSAARLQHELIDQELRDAAIESDSSLVKYLDYVRIELTRAQAWGRFRAVGEKIEDLIADTGTKIVEIVRRGSQPLPFEKFERVATPTFVILYDEVRAIARRNRVVTSVGGTANLPDRRVPTPEDQYLEREYRTELARFPERLRERLTRRQQDWLDALQRAAENEGGGFGILSQVAHELGVDKSQATRATARIAATCRRFRILDGFEPRPSDLNRNGGDRKLRETKASQAVGAKVRAGSVRAGSDRSDRCIGTQNIASSRTIEPPSWKGHLNCDERNLDDPFQEACLACPREGKVDPGGDDGAEARSCDGDQRG